MDIIDTDGSKRASERAPMMMRIGRRTPVAAAAAA